MEEAGFKKINFEPVGEAKSAPKPPEPFVSRRTDTKNMSSRKFPKFGKKWLAVIGVVIALIVIVGAYTSVKAFAIIGQAKKLEAQARVAVAAAKQQNVVAAKDELVKTKTEAEKLQKELNVKFVEIPLFFFS